MVSRSSTRRRARDRAELRSSSFTPSPPKPPRSAICSKWCRRARMPETDAGAEILNLGQDFPPVSTETWEAAIAKDLKGADYKKKLVWRTEEGLAVRPYYRSENVQGLTEQLRAAPGQYPFVRGNGGQWETAQDARPGAGAIRADLLHEAGAHAIQELGYAIAAGVERLAQLTASLPVDTIAAQIELRS